MNSSSTNRILIYTLIAITLIAVYTTINSYYREVRIYQEEEMFKLDCIANAVAYKISGEEHDRLVDRYPDHGWADSAAADPTYQKIHEQLAMTKVMTKVPSEMFTVVKKEGQDHYLYGVHSDRNGWMETLEERPAGMDSLYEKGGPIGLYDHGKEKRLGALSPVMNSSGKTVGVLQVDESFDSFLSKAREQILFNLFISIVFISVIGILIFFSIRSILKRQENLALAKVQVEQLKSQLLANVSHDLRTPLASIHGYLETLLMKKDTLDKEQQEKYLNTTLASTEKLKKLVDELFELSKLESKDRKLHLEVFALQDLANDVANSFRLDASSRQVEIVVDVEKDLPRVKADIELIDRALHNLIGNAVKFCEAGNKVTISTELRDQMVWIHIRDNGIGIAKEDLPNIFSRLYKGKSPKAGSGIGLSIVRGILDLHHSRYTVKSEPGVGTDFSFSLDCA